MPQCIDTYYYSLSKEKAQKTAVSGQFYVTVYNATSPLNRVLLDKHDNIHDLHARQVKLTGPVK